MMQAGYELDKAVAEACGLEYDYFDGGEDDRPHIVLRGPGYSFHDFRPSTDWNDAMLAAKKIGLFLKYAMQQNEVGNWTVFGFSEVISIHESGPVAVSLAILEMKGKANAD